MQRISVGRLFNHNGTILSHPHSMMVLRHHQGKQNKMILRASSQGGPELNGVFWMCKGSYSYGPTASMVVGARPAIKPANILAQKWGDHGTPSQLRRYWLLMGAVEESVFFNVVAPGRVILLQWTIPHLGLYGQEKTTLYGIIFKKTTGSWNWEGLWRWTWI